MKLGRIKQKIKGGCGFLDHSGAWRKILGEDVEGGLEADTQAPEH